MALMKEYKSPFLLTVDFRVFSRYSFSVFQFCTMWGLLWNILLWSFQRYWVAFNHVTNVTLEHRGETWQTSNSLCKETRYRWSPERGVV